MHTYLSQHVGIDCFEFLKSIAQIRHKLSINVVSMYMPLNKSHFPKVAECLPLVINMLK